MPTLQIKTSKRNELIDITEKINAVIKQRGLKDGLCFLFCPHTTAAITINEGADPDVARDILGKLKELVPEGARYHHTEGNADAHIKSVMVGPSLVVPVRNGVLALGTWQSVFFCEFDGPRSRKVFVEVR
jgi:secondary thiamine-phosphate synthase enzyme